MYIRVSFWFVVLLYCNVNYKYTLLHVLYYSRGYNYRIDASSVLENLLDIDSWSTTHQHNLFDVNIVEVFWTENNIE